MTALSLDSRMLPRPADLERCRLGMERWLQLPRKLSDTRLIAFIRSMSVHPFGRPLLEAVFGNSPFLSSCLLRESQILHALLTQGADQTMSILITNLEQDLKNEHDTGRLMQGLRIGKRRAALLIGLADITAIWPLESVTGALSLLAETATRLAVCHLLRQASASGDLVLVDLNNPEEGSGYVVLGMGKVGAKELNYSSDIDLIVLYDENKATYSGRRSLRECFIRLTHNLIRLLSERTADGYVFRTDLRLRPDPGSTAIAVSITAAETYYESFGQNWERAAMIKARYLAGDQVTAVTFLEFLKSYIWRRSLDFAAIQDIHSIKRQIRVYATEANNRGIPILGHDIKLGRGGIRSIEFFTQTQQLIWGGREIDTRQPRTCDALLALADRSHVDIAVSRELITCYSFLRRLEHRLQMVDDQQTQTLPRDPEKLDQLATFMGAISRKSFIETVRLVLETVERHYAHLFQGEPDLSTSGNLVFTGAEDDPNTLLTLQQMGFSNLAGISAAVRGWHYGHYPAVRSWSHRELLTELMPALLTALAHTTYPDSAFMKFDEFLRRLPDGIQIFSLFSTNPHLLTLVVEILGDMPHLAEWLSRDPILLDTMLTPGFLDSLPGCTILMAELDSQLAKSEDNYESILNKIRHWTNNYRFKIGVQVLLNVLSPYEAGRALTTIAEVALTHLYPRVEQEFSWTHGIIPSGSLAIIAMGKMGGYEMTAASDLDLIFVYDAPSSAESTQGCKAIPQTVFYTCIAQRFINAITVMTKLGRLYEVDMRLRPSGRKGPLAVSLESFEKYQVESAWTWEHMALTRARIIYGQKKLTEHLQHIIYRTLVRRRDPDQLVIDVADMRERLVREKKTTSLWAIKYIRGGLIDIEFITQYLQLKSAWIYPEILLPSTAAALQYIKAVGLLSTTNSKILLEAHAFWMILHGLLHQSELGTLNDIHTLPGLKRRLCQATSSNSFEDLKKRIDTYSSQVYFLFKELIEIPALRLRKKHLTS